MSQDCSAVKKGRVARLSRPVVAWPLIPFLPLTARPWHAAGICLLPSVTQPDAKRQQNCEFHKENKQYLHSHSLLNCWPESHKCAADSSHLLVFLEPHLRSSLKMQTRCLGMTAAGSRAGSAGDLGISIWRGALVPISQPV